MELVGGRGEKNEESLPQGLLDVGRTKPSLCKRRLKRAEQRLSGTVLYTECLVKEE